MRVLDVAAVRASRDGMRAATVRDSPEPGAAQLYRPAMHSAASHMSACHPRAAVPARMGQEAAPQMQVCTPLWALQMRSRRVHPWQATA